MAMVDREYRANKLLGIDSNYKTAKGQAFGYMTGILYLAPADLSGWEVCPMRSQGCTMACLNTAGRGGMTSVQASRIAKTDWYFTDRAGFMAQIVRDIVALCSKAEREDYTPCVRLNGTSDIPWERVAFEAHGRTWANIMEMFPMIQFYDYTKIKKRALAHARGEMPANYHLTFSATEDNAEDVAEVLAAGGNVAIVAREVDAIKARLGEVSIHDADEHDLRFLDPTASAGMLKAKGKAKNDTSGFVW